MDNYINAVLKAMNEKLPDGCSVEYRQVKKNNGILKDGFVVREEGNSIAPTFYLTDKERKNLSPDEFANQTVNHFKNERKRGINFDVADFTDVDWVRSHMMFDIVNRSRNEGSDLASIPITPDLMITFKVAIMPDASIRVTNEHMKLWGNITPEELLEDARRNAVVMDKATFRSIGDVLVDYLIEDYKEQHPNVPEDEFRARIKDEMFGDIDGMLYVLSTQQQSNAAMLYPDMLDDIRAKLDDNLVILPSSTREILIMKEKDALDVGLDTVRAMVHEVNRDVVMQDNATEFLSDEILRYDGELKQIDIYEHDYDSLKL